MIVKKYQRLTMRFLFQLYTDRFHNFYSSQNPLKTRGHGLNAEIDFDGDPGCCSERVVASLIPCISCGDFLSAPSFHVASIKSRWQPSHGSIFIVLMLPVPRFTLRLLIPLKKLQRDALSIFKYIKAQLIKTYVHSCLFFITRLGQGHDCNYGQVIWKYYL